jgi:hypothetical protein
MNKETEMGGCHCKLDASQPADWDAIALCFDETNDAFGVTHDARSSKCVKVSNGAATFPRMSFGLTMSMRSAWLVTTRKQKARVIAL